MLIYDSLSHKFDIKLENLYGPGKIMGSVDLVPQIVMRVMPFYSNLLR